ncbi:MAG: Oxidoreductase molybdopterin binding domain protein [Rhodospirillales bacterium]|nr:Oxidoreductase molybdopterin binding domain protein [Rhodospirillales bacterium]
MADDDGEGLIEGVKRKLIETKQRWAGEGRLLTGETSQPGAQRLPPGQREVKNWPVLDLGAKPDVRLDRWHLRIDGLIESPLVWDWPQFLAQPQSEDVSDMHCVTAWSRYDNKWQGVSAKHLLSLVKPLPAARFVVFHAYDGYTTNLPLADFDDDDVFLVHHWEGRPLTREHGGPVRALVPKLYLWKSAKWISRIEFIAEDRPGFWEMRGYHNHGDPWTEQRYGD